MKMTAYKPCPFCGGAVHMCDSIKRVVLDVEPIVTYFIKCNLCGAMSAHLQHEGTVACRWNARAEQVKPAKFVPLPSRRNDESDTLMRVNMGVEAEENQMGNLLNALEQVTSFYINGRDNFIASTVAVLRLHTQYLRHVLNRSEED